jgi:DNA-binding NarL/FixJ family response regulator
MVTILIVDDHPIMRVGIAAIIRQSSEMKVIGYAGSGEEAIVQYERLRPDIVLLDLHLPGIDGVETLNRIRAIQPFARIIILTMFEGDEDIHLAMSAGAKGYLAKGLQPETLLSAIRRVHGGGVYIPPPMARSLESRTTERCLSGREREVLQLLGEGRSNRDIALTLGIRESTVKCHISVILTRLDADDRTQAVITGLKRGFLHLPNPA